MPISIFLLDYIFQKTQKSETFYLNDFYDSIPTIYYGINTHYTHQTIKDGIKLSFL